METRRIEKIEVKLTPAEKDRIGKDFLLSNAPSLSAYVRARLLNEVPGVSLMGDHVSFPGSDK